MATLSEADRRKVWRVLMRVLSARRSPVAVTKQDLKAAIDAADNWIHENAAGYNAALPQPARSNLTPGQKALMLAVLARCRAEDLEEG